MDTGQYINWGPGEQHGVDPSSVQGGGPLPQQDAMLDHGQNHALPYQHALPQQSHQEFDAGVGWQGQQQQQQRESFNLQQVYFAHDGSHHAPSHAANYFQTGEGQQQGYSQQQEEGISTSNFAMAPSVHHAQHQEQNGAGQHTFQSYEWQPSWRTQQGHPYGAQALPSTQNQEAQQQEGGGYNGDGHGASEGLGGQASMAYSYPYAQPHVQRMQPLSAGQAYPSSYVAPPQGSQPSNVTYAIQYTPGEYRPSQHLQQQQQQEARWQPTPEQQQRVQQAQELRLQSVNPSAMQAQAPAIAPAPATTTVTAKAPAKATKQRTPSSPPRPTNALGALRYDVSHCLSDYNTSRDPKACAATLFSLMTTCDPQTETPPTTAASPDPSKQAAANTPTAPHVERQAVFLTTLVQTFKPSMVQALSDHVPFRARLRGWLVKAQRENCTPVLRGVAQSLAQLDLDAAKLAQVKFGKPITIVARKALDPDVRAALGALVTVAEASLAVQEQMEREAVELAKAPALVDEPKPKKGVVKKVATGATAATGADVKKESAAKTTSTVAATTATPTVGARKLVPLARKMDPKKLEVRKAELKKPEAKINTSFFRKDKEVPAKEEKDKPATEGAKSSVLSALAGMKARKKSEVTPPAPLATQEATQQKPPLKIATIVEGLKRSLPSANTQNENDQPEPKKRKTKRVRWRPDDQLEQVKIFEKEEPEFVDEHPGEHGSARDLDRKEGAFMHAGLAFDRDEDFLPWETPLTLIFPQRELATEMPRRGPKRAGTLVPTSKESMIQEERESSVFLVLYAEVGEIPPSPAEPMPTVDAAKENNPPTMIPLPAELRADARVRQILGPLAGQALSPVPHVAPAPAVPIATAPMPAVGATTDITQLLALLANQQTVNAAAPVLPAQAAPLTMPTMSSMPGMPQPFDVSAFANMGMPGLPNQQDYRAPEGQYPGHGSGHPHSNGGGEYGHGPPPVADRGHGGGGRGGHRSGGGGRHGGEIPVDIRPWVKYNTGGQYREVCKFWPIGQCRRGEACGYLHVRDT